MASMGNGPSFPRKRVFRRLSLRTSPGIPLFPFFFAGLLCVLLLADTLNLLPFTRSQVLASPALSQPTVTTTTQDFFKLGNPNPQGQGKPFVRPATLPPVPASAPAVKSQTLSPSTEPATMKTMTYQLDSSFLLNQPLAPAAKAAGKIPAIVNATAIPAGSTPFTVLGSDGRFEVQLSRTSVDIAAATIDGGTAPIGQLALQLSQQYGHYVSQSNFLGTY